MTRQFPFLMAAAFTLLTACHKSPFDRTSDQSGGGGTGQFGQSPSYVIFSNELLSGGGAFEYPSGDNQSLTFDDRSQPLGARSIRYSWNGQAVSNPHCTPNPTHNFAGFNLMHVPLLGQYEGTVGRDLHQAGYTKVAFYVRGSLSTNTVLKIEVASPGTTNACVGVTSPCLTLSSDGTGTDPNSPTCSQGTLTGDWQSFTIPIANSDLVSVKDFFKATFVFIDPFVGNQAPGQGGVAYFDRIQYEP